MAHDPMQFHLAVYSTAQPHSGSRIRTGPGLEHPTITVIKGGTFMGDSNGLFQKDSQGHKWFVIQMVNGQMGYSREDVVKLQDTTPGSGGGYVWAPTDPGQTPAVGPANMTPDQEFDLAIKNDYGFKSRKELVDAIIHNDKIICHRILLMLDSYLAARSAGRSVPDAWKQKALALNGDYAARQKFLKEKGLVKDVKYGVLKGYGKLAHKYGNKQVTLLGLEGLGIAPVVVVVICIIGAVVLVGAGIALGVMWDSKGRYDQQKVQLKEADELVKQIRAYVPKPQQQQMIDTAQSAINNAYDMGYEDAKGTDFFSSLGGKLLTAGVIAAGAMIIIPKLFPPPPQRIITSRAA